MKLALIPPISLLEYTNETWCQLMLPHLTVNEDYRRVYKMHCEDDDQFVILDNGIAEAEVVDWLSLYRIAVDFDVNEIVVPDVMQECRETIEQAESWADQGHAVSDFLQMFVAQGRTIAEFKQCIDWALDQDWIDTIGIPRHALQTTGDPQARSKLAQYIQTHDLGFKDVHLLGGSPEHCCELALYHWPPCVRSTDTSAPFNYAYANKTLRRGNVVRRPGAYFHQPAEAFHPRRLEGNVQKLMDWTGNDLWS